MNIGRDPKDVGATASPRDTEASFRLLVETVRDYAIFMLDPSGMITTWNAGAERLKGYRASEIIGKHFSVFYTAEDRAAGKPERGLRRGLDEGRTEDEGWRVRKDGTLFWADVIITALYDKDGVHKGFAKVTRDLTERKQAEEERLRLVHAEEAVRLREEFMSIAAHELRTPLNALQLQLSVLVMSLDPERHSAPSPEQTAGKVNRALRQVNRLGLLVSRLLEMSRLASGPLSLERQLVDFVACAKDAISTLEPYSARGRIHLDAPEKAMGYWDALRIEQVVGNLVENAISYAEGAPIEISIRADEDVVLLDVSDRGPGVAPGERERIFERFTRGRQSGKGLGLGLYITRTIVNAHGGTIELKDSEVGAHFQVRLPRNETISPSDQPEEGQAP